MAGRGGKTSSFTKEQLQAMGVSGKDLPPAGQMPPPMFPPLVNKPGPPDDNMERQYKIMWKDDFVNFLKDSPYFTTTKSAKLQNAEATDIQKVKEKPNFCWNLMPPELKPNFKRTGAGKAGASNPTKPSSGKRTKPGLSVDDKLKALEEKEASGPIDPSKIKTDPGDKDEEEEQMDDEGLEDDEMDEENDYGNSYFDNGESFNDEDDNLDDGPVY